MNKYISKKCYLIIVLSMLLALPASAQKVITAEGDYVATDDDSPRQSKGESS